MAVIPDQVRLGVRRYFTSSSVHPYDMVKWEKRDARIINPQNGEIFFEQLGVEVPEFWSVNATNILAQKYFRGALGSPEREYSLKQVIDRIVDTITTWGDEGGYFADDLERESFRDELKYIMVTQRAAFNSPVWFNIGVKGVPQQASACFILSVEDTMESILNWYREEGLIFKGGSGAGVNLSKIRSSKESLSGGGQSSGPVSFMRGADASAGTIKSGGKTRRAAKMVVLNVDHPDIRDFIWCKAIEERKARALKDAGFDVDIDGKDAYSLQYQNANNSVRVTDDFMQAVIEDKEWHLKAVTTGEILETVKARDLFREIAQATWECADPGLQFDTTINKWHTAPNTGPITASNPCSEYVHLDNSSCNLASINLLKFLSDDGVFDTEAFKATVETVFLAQEILVGNAHYPTEKIEYNTKRFRQLGLGFANLGAMLMALGLPYDSDQGRAWASSITALMTGHAYLTSAKIAARLGPFAGFYENREPMLRVLNMHRSALDSINSTLAPSNVLVDAKQTWDAVIQTANLYGVRNSQATVIAPTGTISFVLDCDTTGIEPDLSLVKTKKLVGGGVMTIVNQTVSSALRGLGYNDVQIKDIVDYINEHHSVVGAPHLLQEHLNVFATSFGDNSIHYLGHIKMMAAVQPFISGAISKTLNIPESATVEDIERAYIESWKLGLKAVAVYRDNCKVAQPLSSGKGDTEASKNDAELAKRIQELEKQIKSQVVAVKKPMRERLPRKRRSNTFKFRVADCEGYVTVGEYDDGRPGEVFIKVSKQGSTIAGIMDAFSIAVSLGLQHGVPLATYVSKYTNMRFEPAGITDDPDLRIATSLVDYIFRRLALDYLPEEDRKELGILSADERTEQILPGLEQYGTKTVGLSSIAAQPDLIGESEFKESAFRDAPYCYQCGNAMQRAGSCYVCPSCGTTSGCS